MPYLGAAMLAAFWLLSPILTCCHCQLRKSDGQLERSRTGSRDEQSRKVPALYILPRLGC